MYKYFLPFFFLLLQVTETFAQENYTYSGTVRDTEGQPLANTGVTIEGTSTGTLTDARGVFSLVYTKPSAMLVFSRLGYETLTLAAQPGPENTVAAVLPGKARDLTEIPIVSERNPKQNPGIWDYGFLDEYILLLQYKGNSARSRLVYMDDAMNETAALDVPSRVKGLYRDCIGHMHLLYKDSAYRITIAADRIILTSGMDIAAFNTRILPCVAEDRQQLYTLTKEGAQKAEIDRLSIETRNLTLRYHTVNKTTKTRKELLEIVDEKSFRELEDREKYERRLAWKGPRNPKLSDADQAALDGQNPILVEDRDNRQTLSATQTRRNNSRPPAVYSSQSADMSGYSIPVTNTIPPPNHTIAPRDRESDLLFVETIVFKEIYAPLFVVGDDTYIFDFVNSLLLRYNTAGEKVSGTPLSFHTEKGWQRNLQQDPKTKRIYSLYRTSRGFEFREIDPATGAVTGTHPVPADHAENMRVYGGYIYYQYRSDMGSPALYFSRVRIG